LASTIRRRRAAERDKPERPVAGEYPFAGTTVYLYLWHDADSDGVIDSGENSMVASTVTKANGDYSFAQLPAGSAGDRYIVSLAAPASDLGLTTDRHSDITVYNTTNSVGVTLSAYQVMPVPRRATTWTLLSRRLRRLTTAICPRATARWWGICRSARAILWSPTRTSGSIRSLH
jgi:hypothetical protein